MARRSIPAPGAAEAISRLADDIADLGREVGLPLVAACPDISSAKPMLMEAGMPVGAMFDFTEAAGAYWLQGDLALRNVVVAVTRRMAEPFYYDRGSFGSWRDMNVAAELTDTSVQPSLGVTGAVVAPVHLPGSVVGAVVWASGAEDVDVRGAFRDNAERMQVLALRFVCACDAWSHGQPTIGAYPLTRREIQCVKLAAAGKTDAEIAIILDLAAPTVRFHLKKAAGKLGETGRIRTIQHATALGYVSARF